MPSAISASSWPGGPAGVPGEDAQVVVRALDDLDRACRGAAARRRRTAAASPAAPPPAPGTLARQMAPFGETGPPWKSSLGSDTTDTQSGSTDVERGRGDLVEDHPERAVGVGVEHQHDGRVEDAVGEQRRWPPAGRRAAGRARHRSARRVRRRPQSRRRPGGTPPTPDASRPGRRARRTGRPTGSCRARPGRTRSPRRARRRARRPRRRRGPSVPAGRSGAGARRAARGTRAGRSRPGARACRPAGTTRGGRAVVAVEAPEWTESDGATTGRQRRRAVTRWTPAGPPGARSAPGSHRDFGVGRAARPGRRPPCARRRPPPCARRRGTRSA